MDGAIVPGGPPAAVPGTIGSRFVARLIDGLIVIAVAAPLFFLGIILVNVSDILGILFLLAAFIVYLVMAFWVMLWALGETGQTPGKRSQGLMLVDRSTGQPVGGGKAIVRWILESVFSTACYIGYLWAFFDKDNQTLYDKVLDSHVVQVPAGGITPIFPGGKPF